MNFIGIVVLTFVTFGFNTPSVQGFLAPLEPRGPLGGTPPPLGSIWPKPSFHHKSVEFHAVDTLNFDLILLDGERNYGNRIQCDTLTWVLDHYQQLIRSLNPASNGSMDTGISELRIILHSCPSGVAYPEFSSSFAELSQVIIRTDANGRAIAELETDSPWGVIRGLENFYQMLWPADDTYTVYNINATEVIDFPRFVHRGIMIDSSRHFLPAQTIMEILRIMMYNKFNVLHWHLTDDQSFPYVSQKFPELSEKGAYHRSAIYPPQTVQEIIEAARVRGIRVILEFDTPGHVGALGLSHPEILTKCDPSASPEPLAAYENLDPSNEATYEFMKEFFTEVVQNVSKDSQIHLGMDEVYFPCWESSKEIRDFMAANGLETMAQLQGYYTQRHVNMIESLNVTPIAWQDPLDDGTELDPSVVIQVWKENGWNETMVKALQKGHKVLLSACWYLNYIEYGETWRKYFECDPVLGADVAGYESQILGGEAAVWGEYIDQTNILATLFPYSSAVAEVLWDGNRDVDKEVGDVDDAMWRLDDFRCKLLRRGARAQPLLNGYCGPFENDLDL